MNDRERLIVLIQNAVNGCARYWAVLIADYLLANGVIVPPCRVGQTVYQVDTLFEETTITELKVVELTIDNKGIKTLYGATSRGSVYCFDRDYNLNNIKFTKEETEQALKE